MSRGDLTLRESRQLISRLGNEFNDKYEADFEEADFGEMLDPGL